MGRESGRKQHCSRSDDSSSELSTELRSCSDSSESSHDERRDDRRNEKRHHRREKSHSKHERRERESDSESDCDKKVIVKKYYVTNNNKGDVINSSIPAYSDFYALMPGDNIEPIAAGTAVQFPRDGPTNGEITRVNASVFNLKEIGTYEVQFQVSVTEAGQLDIALDTGSGFSEDPASVVGRATGTSQIVGISLINTTIANTKLSIFNPTGNTPALTVTPVAGGTHMVSCHLVIKRLT